jgi:hypothetical protein
LPYAQFSEQAQLNAMFGNAFACVHTGIAASATAQTTIAIGSTASGGTGGTADTTPSSNGLIWIGTPGTGATQNQYSIVHAMNITSSTSSAITIPSQSIGQAISIGDFIFQLGITTGPLPAWVNNTLYLGLTTQAVSGATQANILSNEPTSTGSYARIVVLNNVGNWGTATAATPSVTTSAAVMSFAASTSSGWSTGATNLVQLFISDAPTLAGGHVLAFGALGTPQAVASAGVTLSFASGAITITLT